MYNFFSENFEYDECTAHGACSVPPGLSALHEIILITLEQTAFYVLKLKNLGADTSEFESIIIDTFANIVSTTDYSDEQLLIPVSMAYKNLLSARMHFKKLAKELNIPSNDIKDLLRITPKMPLSHIISMGEKFFLEKYKSNTNKQKNYREIIIFLLKGISANLSAITSYKPAPKYAIERLISALNFLNKKTISEARYNFEIKLLCETDKKLMEELAQIQLKEYGEIQSVKVSKSTEKGKAVLVSGSNIKDLKNLLDFIGEEKLDVYTHDDLLIAHAFKAFENYKNLKGHYGTCNDNCVFDFATFPGAILLTKNSNVNTEYLYRGRLFTTSKILPKGVISVKNDDFSAVISSANDAKGFAKGQERAPVWVGADKSFLDKQIEDIIAKFNSKKIKNLVVLGLLGKSKLQYEYFEKLVKLIPKDVFVLSFSYNKSLPNLLHINFVNNRPLIYGFLYKLFKQIPANSERISFFFGKCDVSSISNMIYMKQNGVKNLYLTNCSPNIINPNIQSFLQSNYKLKTTTEPQKDLEKILNKNQDEL